MFNSIEIFDNDGFHKYSKLEETAIMNHIASDDDDDDDDSPNISDVLIDSAIKAVNDYVPMGKAAVAITKWVMNLFKK